MSRSPPALNPVDRKSTFKIGLTCYLVGPAAGSPLTGLNLNLNQSLKRIFIRLKQEQKKET